MQTANRAGTCKQGTITRLKHVRDNQVIKGIRNIKRVTYFFKNFLKIALSFKESAREIK